VSNVINFPLSPVTIDRRTSAVITELEPHHHAVQFYEEEGFLFDTVGEFVGAGLRAGDRIVIIATTAHHAGFAQRLDESVVDSAIASGQLTILDARETLAKFMIGDMPDPDLFRDVLGRILAKMQGDDPLVPIRAYGEMVDLLWRAGNSRAAIRLEELWNEASNAHSFSLLCAYVMGNFYKEGDAAHFMEVCRNHTHVIPTESFTQLDDGAARLREISLLQQRARALESEVAHRKELENALRDALRERSRAEEELRASVTREKEARTRAEESDAFKEVFLGILGHDLRNPLNTVLTTARLMVRRGDVAPDTQTRLNRIVSSSLRMQRMIEQILDVTRARLADGIPIAVSAQKIDMVALVSKIADELRAAHPKRAIELQTSAPCRARVDNDRFEQVVSNLIGNAIQHGDPELPIRVVVSTRGNLASISVKNHGTPIDPELMPHLFDPFKRGAKATSADGLGLGLYIAERIVSAHGGKIAVESSDVSGTCFEAIVPRDPA
jgi:signal transduction histidine kinase